MTNQINNFFLEFNNYIDQFKKKEIKDNYQILYIYCKKIKIKNKITRKFIRYYKHLNKYIKKYNKKFINKQRTLELFNNINGYTLDENQKKVVITDEINTQVIAGAGSGKSLTIIGKIYYLIKILNIDPKDILVISFTNDSCNSLKNKLNFNLEVLTFHKLALKLLKDKQYRITNTPLEYIVDEYFSSLIYQNEKLIKNVLILLNDKQKSIESYTQYLNSNKLKNLKKIIISFISIFKAYNYNLKKFIEIKDKKYKYLIRIIIDIYLIYQQELKSQNEIDFNDMINLATKEVKERKIKLNYKYIIVDEYQDTSITRYQLLKEIIRKTNAKFIAVGDDWQSIYKFTGCNLDIFINFEKYFGYTKKIYLKNTYRNSQQLIDIATKFIQKNKNQLKKKLLSPKNNQKPIKIIIERENILEKTIKHIIKKGIKHILILGRNTIDIYEYLNDQLIIEKDIIKYQNNKEIFIRYLTIHKSKGLEAECVILINLKNNNLGFPSKIKNHKIIEYLIGKEKYPYEEERRLFYVALTRTKNEIYLITPSKNQSIFVKEIIKNNQKYIEFIDFND